MNESDYLEATILKNKKKKQETSSKVKTQCWGKMTFFAASRSGDGALGLLECGRCGKTYEFEPLVENAPPKACPTCGYAGENEIGD